MDRVHLHALWIGERLGYLERLCLASAAAAGHPFTLWSYDAGKLEGVPAGTDLRDAAEVMPRERLQRFPEIALGADFWRIELLTRGLGCWVDMDLIFLKPLDFAEPYIFGWEYENWINNAVLYAPPDSAMIADMNSIPQPNRRPPWWGPRKSLEFYWRRLRQGSVELEDYPWGTFSAGLVTHVVKSHGLQRHAQPPEVFYPVRWKDARVLYAPAAETEALIRPNTRTVHMWHSRLKGLSDAPPPPGSFVEKMCSQFGVDTSV